MVVMEAQEDKMSKQKTKDPKRVHFYADKDSHIRFKSSLEKYNMTMSEFFRACCEAVVEDDDAMVNFIQEYRDRSEKHSKRTSKFAGKDLEKSNALLEELGIGEDDIEGLFDFIAKQHPEI
jgi:ribosome assembly protein YihI (activator of Der GTPase)